MGEDKALGDQAATGRMGGVTMPAGYISENFIQDFYSRTVLFVKTLVDPSVTDVAILHHLLSIRVAVVGSKEVLLQPNGQYMAAMTVNLLSRFCPNLTLFIPETMPCTANMPLLNQGPIAEALVRLAQAVNPCVSITLNPPTASKYHASIAIGRGAKDVPSTVTINSDGWISFLDTNGNPLDWASENVNPIGAYISACLGVAEVFKEILFRLLKRETAATLRIGSLAFSALDYGFMRGPFVNPSLPGSFRLGSLHFISMGALNSAVLYALCSLAGVSGDLIVIEPQGLDVSNLNRYVFLTAGPAINGTPKVTLSNEIASPYFGSVRAIPLDYRSCRERITQPMDLAIVGVDNNEGRWDVQLDFPNCLICGGTERGQVTVSCHDRAGNKACVGCVYSAAEGQEPSQSQPIPTISFVSAFSGFLMAAEVLKARLAELNGYKLDLLLDVEGLRSSSIQVRRPPKSPDCKCNCSGRALSL